MNNRKVLIAIIIVLIIMIVALAILIIINPFKNTDQKKSTPVSEVAVPTPSEPEEEGPDYEGILNEFISAVGSAEDMKTYIDENLDFKSYYLLAEHSDNLEIIPSEYEDLDEKLYQNKDFVKTVEDYFVLEYVNEENVDAELEVGEVKSMEPIGVDIWNVVQFTLKGKSGEELEFGAIFCEEQLVEIMDYAIFDALFEAVEEDDDIETAATQMTTEEKNEYNANVKKYISDDKKGSEVKLMIEEIIASNEENVGELGKFISIHNGSTEEADENGVTTGNSGVEKYNDGNDGSDDKSLGGVMKLANIYEDKKGENTDENVEKATTAMRDFTKNLSSGTSYKIEAKFKSGVIYAVYISIAE